MATERTLNDPLSGAEIKEIIMQQIETSLNGDSTLLDDIAYAGFTVNFDIKISFLRSLTKPTQVWGVGGSFDQPIKSEDISSTAAIVAEHTSNPSPDLERQNHDLPIPVMVQTPAGMERQKVRLGRPPKVRT